jgi:hypothetical protein
LVTGLISTPLYLENGKTNTSVGILYKEHFTRNIKGNNNQICLKNKRSRYKKKKTQQNTIFWHLGASRFRSEFCFQTKSKYLAKDHPMNSSIKFDFNWPINFGEDQNVIS